MQRNEAEKRDLIKNLFHVSPSRYKAIFPACIKNMHAQRASEVPGDSERAIIYVGTTIIT